MSLVIRKCKLFIIAVLFFLASCANPFNPDSAQTSNDVAQTVVSTPEATLLQLENAYNRQDIELYKECLSDSFHFILINSEYSEIGVDMNNDGIKDNWWGFEQEVNYHENLFTSGSSDGLIPTPVSVNLNLQIPPKSLWEQENETGENPVYIIPCNFDLVLTYSDFQDINAYGYSRFWLILEDDMWKIYRWQDESNI
ncbi:MAG: hypothetical protein CSB55_07580 [Candidatus Cloacimonadota bacterium]|nr:MAG: hypothetical protein CSB55_07580 [Candidatus Cloacimonadota bacterium]